MPHHLTERQWVDRFLGRLGSLVPSIHPCIADLRRAQRFYTRRIWGARPLSLRRVAKPVGKADPNTPWRARAAELLVSPR